MHVFKICVFVSTMYECNSVQAHVCFSELVKELMQKQSPFRITTGLAQLFVAIHIYRNETEIWQLDMELPEVGMFVGFF